jgi:hypothetical protein
LKDEAKPDSKRKGKLDAVKADARLGKKPSSKKTKSKKAKPIDDDADEKAAAAAEEKKKKTDDDDDDNDDDKSDDTKSKKKQSDDAPSTSAPAAPAANGADDDDDDDDDDGSLVLGDDETDVEELGDGYYFRIKCFSAFSRFLFCFCRFMKADVPLYADFLNNILAKDEHVGVSHFFFFLHRTAN